jgi:hypothetical protein
MTEKPQVPPTGSMGRKIYDLIVGGDGITEQDVVEKLAVSDRVAALRIAEMADKGLISSDEFRLGGGISSQVWRVAKDSGGAAEVADDPPKAKGDQKLSEEGHPSRLAEYECPACGESVHVLTGDMVTVRVFTTEGDQLVERVELSGGQIRTNTQRRFVVIDPDGPFDANGLYRDPLSLVCEETGRVVFGRRATRDEVDQMRKEKAIKKPFCVGFENHLRTCAGVARWIDGSAADKERTMDMEWSHKNHRFEWVERTYRKRSKDEAPDGGIPVDKPL